MQTTKHKILVINGRYDIHLLNAFVEVVNNYKWSGSIRKSKKQSIIISFDQFILRSMGKLLR